MRTNLRRGLTAAIKAKDRVTVAALRSALAAIDNAEASSAEGAGLSIVENEHVAGSAVGLGAGEGERRLLTDGELRAIIESEVRERSDAAGEYELTGHHEAARRLRDEADVLTRYIPAS